jgi:hypothetical protein
MYFTEQLPLESLHTSTENFPAPLVDQVTFPVGERPATATVSFTAEPTTTKGVEADKEIGESEVEVEADVVDDTIEIAVAVEAVEVVLVVSGNGRGSTLLVAVVTGVLDTTTTPTAAGESVRTAEKEASNKTTMANTANWSRNAAHPCAVPPLFKVWSSFVQCLLSFYSLWSKTLDLDLAGALEANLPSNVSPCSPRNFPLKRRGPS